VGDLAASARARDPKILPKHWVMMAASAVIFEDGKLLLVRDPHGFWSGVGGFVEAGESPHETIVREVREELGVESQVIQHFRPFVAWNVAQPENVPVSFLLFPHGVKLASLDFKPEPAEVTDIAWVAPELFGDYEMLPHIRSIFNQSLPEWLAG
jgi:8-oxo-dGTP diphosphatase